MRTVLHFCIVMSSLFGTAAGAAELSVADLVIAPGATGALVVSGNIAGESTFGYTAIIEIIPRAGSHGFVRFTAAPPEDILQVGDPWPDTGTFTAFDTDVTMSTSLNGCVDDNGTFVAEPTTFAGELASYPITASGDASGVWDAVLSTSQGASGWEGLPTAVAAGKITVGSGTPIPALSTWGLIITTLLAFSAGTVVFRPSCRAARSGYGSVPVLRFFLGGKARKGRWFLPVTPGGSNASPDRQVNAPPVVEQRPALRFSDSADSVTGPRLALLR